MTGQQTLSFVVQSVTYATPLLLASLGELFSERVGVINIGLEGLMLTGCLAGVYGAAMTHSPYVGLLLAILAGMAGGGVFAFFGVSLKRDQVIVGTTLNFLALGLTGMLYRAWTHGAAQSIDAPALPLFGGKSGITFNLLTLAALLLVPLTQWLLYRTRLGVILRTTGELPEAAAAAGTAVNRLRVLVCLATGALCGAGGASLAIGINNTFAESMTSGRGFIALAVVVFGRWNPWGALGASLLFAAADVAQTRMQAAGTYHIPYPIFLAVPYILTLLALAVRGAKVRAPAALGVPFEQG